MTNRGESNMTTTITMRAAIQLYRYGNDHGQGYAPDADDATIDAAVTAAEADGWTVVLPRHHSDEIVVLTDEAGTLVGIGGDARGDGAWAVVLSDQVERLVSFDAADIAELGS
jgi:hypothetical protein